MCGIVGSASIDPQATRAWLRAGRDALAHRGPDGAGEWWSEDGRVGLAHRRLAILELSPLGHQPMHLRQRDIVIVFNGEIYNFAELRTELEQRGHRFGSHSDTEVLLASYAEWGTACLSRLNGAFAFAIHDARQRRLFLARDRAGEKPLFYRVDGGTLYFASELKALLTNPRLPRRIDPEALDCYLSMGFVPGSRCILEGYRKLPPAHAMSFDLACGELKIWRYWQVPELVPGADASDETELLDELEGLLQSAVARQLVADVPVGVLLSGGVDSSLITAMAVRSSDKVRTFSVGFPGHGVLDETPHARMIAQHFRTEHIEIAAEAATADLVSRLAQQFDEPVVDSSMLPTWMVSHLVRQHCSVALGGDGGDELFGGYKHYTRLIWLKERLGGVPHCIRDGAARAAERWLPVGSRGKNYLQALAVDLRHGLPSLASYFDRRAREQLMRGWSRHVIAAEAIHAERVPVADDVLQRATRKDFSDYLAEDILVKVDRASMLNSLEVRAPLLDARVLEFAFARVPSSLKATAGARKILLKRLAARLLPPDFDLQRKQGFSIPMDAWLRKGSFRELFWGTLSSADSMFDAATVRSLLDGQDRGRNNGERLFALVQFELWRRHYGAAY